MLITKKIKIKLGSNKEYYKKLGYNIENNENNEILIDVNHLSKGSHSLVEVKCDICNTEKIIKWKRYITNISKCNLYTCSSKCARVKVETSNLEKYGVKNVSSIPAIRDKAKKTMLDKYGVEYGMQTDEFKNKYKKTCLNKYGVENVIHSEEIQEKIKQTNLKKYGCEYASGSEIVKERIKEAICKKYGDIHFSKTKEVLEKRKATNLKKYGCEYYLQTKERVNKSRIAFKKKYGVDWVTSSEEIKNKIKCTIIAKYGVDNIFKSEEIKDKIKSTNLKKYGVDNIFKSSEMVSKFKDKTKTWETKTLIKYRERINNNYTINSYSQFFFNIKHLICDNHFDINIKILNDRINYSDNVELCTICNPIGSFSNSSIENNICTLLDNLNVKYIKNDRKILEGKELDIFIPTHNLAIEINGLYWHSELFKNKSYHLEKTLKCNVKNIHLIHLFEDDILSKYDIAKSIILNKLGLITNKIFARKCKIREVNSSDSIIFLNENHIQGGCKSAYKLGLYYEDELVSLMTFGYRYTNSKKEFELIRFCNKINTNVIGASSKLFKHFIKKYEIEEKYILSYSDLSLFDGGMYKTLGFEYKHLSKPNYFWVIDNKRFHRFIFNKQKLIKEGFDPLKTEVQIMHERGYYRIYGCGQVRWEYKL